MKMTFQGRCLVLGAFVTVAFSVISYQLVKIQWVDRVRYAESSRKAFDRVEPLPAQRGTIVDRREETLAKSIPVSSVYLDRYQMEDPKMASYALAYQEASSEDGWERLTDDQKSKKLRSVRGQILAEESKDEIIAKHLSYMVGVLARPLGMKREELRQKIEGNKSKWFPIVKDLPEDMVEGVREIVSKSKLQGVEFLNSNKRWYTAPNAATHVMGYTGEVEEKTEDGKSVMRVVGKFGVESSMESSLAGRDGWRAHRRDAYGLVVPGDSTDLMPPRAGLNVQLTLDMGIQSIVEEELDAALAEFESERGAVVMLDPKSGEILAMASRPHFDLNRRENVAENGYNYALQAIYEPGSTFKVVATAGVLNEGLATPQTSVFCHNGLYVEGAIQVPDHHPYGSLTLEGVLIKSSNVGAYKFARQLGPKRFYDYVKKFGFGVKTGISLSGESAGVARNTNNPVDFSRASYGYALNVTPLQMACAYGVVAGEGKLLKPRIVKALVANDGTVVEQYEPEVISQVLKPEVAKKMRAALQKVTEPGGTATTAAVAGYHVAGKTGTAKKHNPKGGGYLNNSYIVSFAGMMPAEDPRFVCIVVIDDPRTNKVTRYGGTIAAPVFGRIAARTANYMGIPPMEVVKPTTSERKKS